MTRTRRRGVLVGVGLALALSEPDSRRPVNRTHWQRAVIAAAIMIAIPPRWALRLFRVRRQLLKEVAVRPPGPHSRPACQSRAPRFGRPRDSDTLEPGRSPAGLGDSGCQAVRDGGAPTRGPPSRGRDSSPGCDSGLQAPPHPSEPFDAEPCPPPPPLPLPPGVRRPPRSGTHNFEPQSPPLRARAK